MSKIVNNNGVRMNQVVRNLKKGWQVILISVSLIFILAGCSTGSGDLADKNPEEIVSKEQQETDAVPSTEEMRNDETPRAEETESDRTAQVEAAKGDESSQTGGTETDRNSSGTEEVPSTGGAEAGKIQKNNAEAAITDAAWSHYFGGINGSAVIYDPALKCYQIYNQELALTRRSPCSTFKIISSLIALEYGVIDPEKSTRTWSGETFWNEDWNRDIDFDDAFHASCVWYFRQVIDDIGKDRMQENLDRLQYGNCDISDWEGRLNTNNNNPALTGFWIESSLLISPKEQTEVMERIFGDHTDYREETVSRLEQVMFLTEENGADISIYGKTGMGKAAGVVVNAWFTGFADTDDRRIYFCVYLGETDSENVSSTRAREIAIEIVSDYLG